MANNKEKAPIETDPDIELLKDFYRLEENGYGGGMIIGTKDNEVSLEELLAAQERVTRAEVTKERMELELKDCKLILKAVNALKGEWLIAYLNAKIGHLTAVIETY
jgi:hypothetical protein